MTNFEFFNANLDELTQPGEANAMQLRILTVFMCDDICFDTRLADNWDWRF